MNSSDEDIALQVTTISAVAFEDITTESIGTRVSISADDIQFVTTGILSTIFIVFGTGGNILSILVWAGKSMKSTTGTYLIALALADLGNLWFTFFTDSLQLIYPEMKRYCQFGTFYSYIGYPGHMIFVTCSIWITVGLTADRCIKVRWMDLAQV